MVNIVFIMKSVIGLFGASVVWRLLGLSSEFKVSTGKKVEKATNRLAILIAGVEDSFTWAHAPDRVVSAAHRQGYNVDLFIRLVAHGEQNGVQWTSGISNETNSDIHVVLHDDAARVRLRSWNDMISHTPGAQVKVLELLDHKEQIDIPQPAPVKMPFYSPSTTKTGRNVLRKFKSTEYLMNKAKAYEKAGEFAYNLVMVAREDPTWLSPVNMHALSVDGYQNVAFSRNCLQWGGLNDKAIVFGRSAAEKTLTKLYSEFWTNPVVGHNAEVYWKEYIASKGVESVLLSPEDLAVSDTRWRHWKPCQSMIYHCTGTYEQQPVLC